MNLPIGPQSEQTGAPSSLRRLTPIERLPEQLQQAERRVERLKRLQQLLDDNPDMREALDIIFEGGLL